ncbi:MAG: hypothetical protein IIC67_07485, partial [Thaumarchaeota archaeon]|nr:hypothetical protein [Nitrososphaerota archaeon]
MTVRIKLTEDDIELDEAGVVPNGLQVKIYIDHQTGFEKAKQLKQQILDDQELREEFKKIIKDSKGRVNTSIDYFKELQENDILFIVDRFYPTDEAFVEEVYSQIFPQMGYKVELIMRSKQTVNQSVLEWHGNKVYIIPNDMATTNPLMRSWRNLKSAYIIYKISKSYRRKIVIVRNWSWGLLAALFARFFNGYNLIYQRSYPRELLFKDVHEGESGFIYQLKMLRMKIWSTLTIYAMKRCDAIFPVSVYMKQDMVKDGIDPSIMHPVPYGCVIPPELDPEKIENIRKSHKLSGKQLMLYFGTFIKP